MNLTKFRQSRSSDAIHYMVLGNPVSHSFSPLMHNTALEHYGMNGRYFAVEVQPDELTDLASHLHRNKFRGANITLPYKQTIIDYLDQLNSSAREIKAVNTIVKKGDRLVGYNTDVYGFSAPLSGYRDRLQGGRAIVFGTGGASRAVVAALLDLGMVEIVLISRNPDKAAGFEERENVYVAGYDAWTSLSVEAGLIVNATPLGMYPESGKCPIRTSEKQFLGDCICYDIIYNPPRTTFLSLAAEVGAVTIGGLDMLIQQGSRSFELWTGKPFPVDKVRQRLHEEINR